MDVALGIGGVQRQEQIQKLSPQMRRSIEMLAKSLPELREELFRELAANPVIDEIETTIENKTISEKECESDMAGRAMEDDYSYGSPEEPSYGADEEAIERRSRFFDSQTKEETLEEHLAAQIATSEIDPADAPLAGVLIGELDDDGYFRGSMPDIAMVSGESEEKIRSVLAAIMDFDPPGCGATTLEECLLAQLDKLDGSPYRDEVEELIRRGHLKDVAEGNSAAVMKDLGTSEERYEDVLAALRSLDPRPARAFGRSGKGVAYVNPEVHAVKRDGRWIAVVDDRSLPDIRFSNAYVEEVDGVRVPRKTFSDGRRIDDATRDFIRKNISAAEMLAEAVERREETVRRIAQAIFDAQPGFFEKGLKGLVPMTMQQIADATGVHHTTVSRTVRDKYASTPRGTVELRSFFTAGCTAQDGTQVSRSSVLDALSALVRDEDKSAPLSDDALSAKLKAGGFAVARRTVAKYRAMLGIPGAFDRRGGL